MKKNNTKNSEKELQVSVTNSDLLIPISLKSDDVKL